MIEFVGLILFAVLFISNRSLGNRVQVLEAKIKNGAPEVSGVPTYVPGSSPSSATAPAVVAGGTEENIVNQVPRSPAVTYGATRLREADTADQFATWLKEDWLMKLGVFIFILGLGWFVSYAFANNWIGPVGRISLGIIAGALVMAFAFWRMARFPQQGGVFMALGAGMVVLSIFAGRSVYGFFDPVSAIMFDFIVAAFVSFVSYKFSLRSLVLFAQVLAFIAPVLVAGKTDSVFLFSYLLVISLATLFLGGLMAWRGLILSSLVFVGLYSFPYVLAASYGNLYSGPRHIADAPIILNFAYVFAILYLLSGMFAVMRQRVQEVKGEIVLALLNGVFLFLWIYNVAGQEWKTLLFAAWAIVFGIGSFIAFRLSSKPDSLYAYGSVAIAFIAAATTNQLHGAALTISLTVEVSLLVMVVLALTKNVKAATSVSLLFIAPVALSLGNMSQYLVSTDLITKDTFVLLVLALSLIIAGRVIHTAEKENQAVGSDNTSVVLVVLGTVYIWFTIWCFLHILMPFAQDMATFSALTVYTIVGLWAYFVGLLKGNAVWKIYGSALVVFVIARLLFIDVWAMALSERIITFFVIGILLMSTAFLTKRKSTVV